MSYNPDIHHRKSIRLKGYNYAQAGLYFVTICTQNRACLFGEIMDGEMKLNNAGTMIVKWHGELENKFPDIRCHEMITMPNHLHCIIENIGTDLHVSPENNGQIPENGQSHRIAPTGGTTLYRVVQWFKTMTTNEYIRGVKTLHWTLFDGKLWQRNYWEHIIRNHHEYQSISEYIIRNPQNWDVDKLKA